ncbi:MAG: energy-coupled thiamine transporter ThiT [Clostridia bacterium]|nr:energy-coupled thiamine transporter ThiT [Clostridia bacterium]
MNQKQKLLALTECALMLALATALSFVKLYQAPLGGSVTLLSTLPIMFISFRFGVARGVACGFVYSLIQLWQGSGNLAYVPTTAGIVGCIALDYLVPFTLLGLAGLFYKKDGSAKAKTVSAVLGVLLATLLRFGCHFLGGAVVWYEITKAGEWNDYVQTVGMWTYSFVYNITYLGPDGALAIAASPVIPLLDKVLKPFKK